MTKETVEARALRIMDLDPATHVVVGTPKFSRWQVASGAWRESVKVDVAERGTSDVDLDGLVRVLRKRPVAAKIDPTGTFVVALADWQLGKGGKDGKGVAKTVALLQAGCAEAEARVKLLRKQRPLGTLILAGLGDIVEACDGHYPKQAFEVALDNRQQDTLARELITMFVSRLAPLFPRVILTAVPGNHGESRAAGKANTQTSDNRDVAVFEQVSEALALSGRFDHVEWVQARGNEPWVVFPHGKEWGAGLCLFHGHLAKSGEAGILKWWAGQSHGRQAPAKAGVLVTGHYHHLRVDESSGRTWIQAPTVEPGSDWWRDSTGQQSRPGTLTFVLTPEGADDIKVLGRV